MLELEQLARAAHERLTQFAEEEVTRRWSQLEEVSITHAPANLMSTEMSADAKGVAPAK